MTWQELHRLIENMTDEQKQTDVTVYGTESTEFFSARELMTNQGLFDELDPEHPFIIIDC